MFKKTDNRKRCYRKNTFFNRANHKTNDKRIRVFKKKKEILCTNAHAVLYTSTSLSERPDINVVSRRLCSRGTVSFSKEIRRCTRHVRCDDVRKKLAWQFYLTSHIPSSYQHSDFKITRGEKKMAKKYTPPNRSQTEGHVPIPIYVASVSATLRARYNTNPLSPKIVAATDIGQMKIQVTFTLSTK